MASCIIKVKFLFQKYCEQILYLFFGGLTTIINWGISLILYELVGASTGASTVIAWIASVIFAYSVNKIFVFRSKQSSFYALTREFFRFMTARILSFGIDYLIMVISVDKLLFNFTIVKILSNIVVIIINYFASKFLIFQKKPKKNKPTP